MQKLWVSLCVGQNQGVQGRGWGSRGWGDTWKCIQVGPTHRWLYVGGGGCMYVCTEMLGVTGEQNDQN